MSKRSCPFDDNLQAVKKQETLKKSSGRQILSMASERTLQLLYRGAANQFTAKLLSCNQCPKVSENELKCFYCDKMLCPDCSECCSQCEQDYCKDCVFNLPDRACSVCYSCY